MDNFFATKSVVDAPPSSLFLLGLDFEGLDFDGLGVADDVVPLGCSVSIFNGSGSLSSRAAFSNASLQ
jgi:hypothetical protein